MKKSPLHFRTATREDLPAIVAMLADDPLGAQREQYSDPLPETYHYAFEAITEDPNNELIVALQAARVIGVLQLTFIPYLTYQGSWRALVEGVRISKKMRGKGFGRRLLQEAIDRARQKGCRLVQLATDKQRDTLRFYQSLGFVASHEGLKLHLAK